jgi:hypothetical protein
VTWAQVKATGRGKLAFRLFIEGFRTQFVTDSEMQILTDDPTARIRAVGLQRQGIVIEESVHIPEADLEQGSVSLTIVDVGGRATAAGRR